MKPHFKLHSYVFDLADRSTPGDVMLIPGRPEGAPPMYVLRSYRGNFLVYRPRANFRPMPGRCTVGSVEPCQP